MADPSMVTDDLIKTRQMIFQQPDWPRACEMNGVAGPRDPQAQHAHRRRSALHSRPRRWCCGPPRTLGPVDEAKRIASLIPHAQLAVMDNCGHWPQYEDTETFNQIHLDFLLSATRWRPGR